MQRDFQYYEELLSRLEGILQADGTVEHQMAGGAVLAVRAEVAQTHELIGRGRLGVPEAGLHLAAGEDFQRLLVQTDQKILKTKVQRNQKGRYRKALFLVPLFGNPIILLICSTFPLFTHWICHFV